MNSFNHSENDTIKKFLQETADQIEPNSMFIAQLENKLKQTHIPKKGFNMPSIKNITSVIAWAGALTALVITVNWFASQIAPQNDPAASITKVATIESTPSPSPTVVESSPTPITPTFITLPTSTASIFRDDFEGLLGEGWQWIYENKEGWSLANNPGWLEIMAGYGSVNGGNLYNLFLRPRPEGNFELETKLRFNPTEELQFAGLLIYESSGDHLQFGRGFCEAPQCVGNGLYFDNMSNASFDAENFATQANATEILYLRLRVEENNYTAYASENGEDWYLIGTHTNEMKLPLVGLIAGQSFTRDNLVPAQFDYFVINSLP